MGQAAYSSLASPKSWLYIPTKRATKYTFALSEKKGEIILH